MKMCQYLFLIVFFAITTNSLSQITSSENGSETHSSEYPSESLQTDINQRTSSVSSLQFCSSNEILNVVFIIGHKIYFGQNDSLYSFDLKLKEVGEKQTIEQFFTINIRNTNFKTIRTAVHYDYNSNVGNATDLVVILGDLTVGGIDYFRYNSYRFESGLGLREITDENEMPWGLKTEEKYEDSFWFENPSILKPKCLTFDQTKDIFYSIGSVFNNPPLLVTQQLTNNSIWDNNWQIIDNVDYEALFHVFGSIYGLDNNNTIHRITQENGSVIEHEKFDVKVFFNCDGNSPLMAITFPTEDTTVSDTTVENTNENTFSVSGDSSKSDDIQTITTDSVLESRTEKSSSLVWIIVLIVILIVVIIIVALICFMFLKKSDLNETKPKIIEQKSSVASNEHMVDMSTVPTSGETELKPTPSVSESQLEKTTSISSMRSSISRETKSMPTQSLSDNQLRKTTSVSSMRSSISSVKK